MVEAAVLGHAGVQRILASMPEGRVAEIVAKRNRFRQIVVQPQGARERARDLRHLDRVGEAGAEMVALVVDEHLRLMGKPAEGRRMDDAVRSRWKSVRVAEGGSATRRRARAGSAA